jgi:hypothetical protein
MQKFSLLAQPAYGRTYNSHEEVLKDWYDGKDFYSLRGYFSIRDREYIHERHGTVTVQYGVGKEVILK